MDAMSNDDDLPYIGTPNCPSCLERMDAVIGAWWCSSCGISLRPEDENR